MPTLDEIVIEGWRTGPYGPGLDPAIFMNYTPVPGESPPDIGSFFGGAAGEEESFVAPVAPPQVLPPRAPVAPPAAALPLAEIIVAATRAVAPVVGLLAPVPIAPEPYPGDLLPFDFAPFHPQSPDALPEVTVIGARPPAPPAVILPTEFLQPPNWNDLLHGYDFYYEWPYVVAGWAPDGTSADSFGRYVELPGSAGVDPTPQPGTRASPVARPDVYARPGDAVAPDLYSDPMFDVFGLPLGSPSAQPFAPPRTQPRTDNPTQLSPDLLPGIGDDVFSPVVAPPRAAPAPNIASPPSFDPFDPLNPLASPSPPTNDAGNCRCPKVTCKPPKKKKRKKKKPRSFCQSGTYVETKTGTKKSPLEFIPCQ